MGVLLLVAQAALLVLRYGSRTLAIGPWLVWLPAIVFALLWLVAISSGTVFQIDTFNDMFVPRRRRRRW